VGVYCLGIRLALTAAARRLASPSGGGAQCAHWAERAFRPPLCIEPGDTQRRGFTAWVSGSHCRRPLAACWQCYV